MTLTPRRSVIRASGRQGATYHRPSRSIGGRHTERNAEPSFASSVWNDARAVLLSWSLLVGAAILVGSILLAGAQDAPEIALLGFVGDPVAGLLAPPRPWTTGLCLGLLHAAAALAVRELADPEPPSDGLAQIAAGAVPMLFAYGIIGGVLVTGLSGHLIRLLRTRPR